MTVYSILSILSVIDHQRCNVEGWRRSRHSMRGQDAIAMHIYLHELFSQNFDSDWMWKDRAVLSSHFWGTQVFKLTSQAKEVFDDLSHINYGWFDMMQVWGP